MDRVPDGGVGSTGTMRPDPASPRADVDVECRGHDARPGKAERLWLGALLYHGGLRWRVRSRNESRGSDERELARMLLGFRWLRTGHKKFTYVVVWYVQSGPGSLAAVDLGSWCRNVQCAGSSWSGEICLEGKPSMSDVWRGLDTVSSSSEASEGCDCWWVYGQKPMSWCLLAADVQCSSRSSWMGSLDSSCRDEPGEFWRAWVKLWTDGLTVTGKSIKKGD